MITQIFLCKTYTAKEKAKMILFNGYNVNDFKRVNNILNIELYKLAK